MKTRSNYKPENTNTSKAITEQQTLTNQQVELIAALFNFIKHPTVSRVAGYLLENYLESKKQDEEQEKLTKKLKRQIESLKKQVKQLSKEQKTFGTNEWPPLRLIKNKSKNKKAIPHDLK